MTLKRRRSILRLAARLGTSSGSVPIMDKLLLPAGLRRCR
jgi:hypothetical protein